MWKYNGAIACMCGGALLGGAAAGCQWNVTLGAIVGGIIGMWVAWPR